MISCDVFVKMCLWYPQSIRYETTNHTHKQMIIYHAIILTMPWIVGEMDGWYVKGSGALCLADTDKCPMQKISFG